MSILSLTVSLLCICCSRFCIQSFSRYFATLSSPSGLAELDYNKVRFNFCFSPNSHLRLVLRHRNTQLKLLSQAAHVRVVLHLQQGAKHPTVQNDLDRLRYSMGEICLI